MSDKIVKEDPIKMHKAASSLMESGKYAEAMDMFVIVADLYNKGQNYFGSAEMYYKAGECAANLKDYQKGEAYFMKSSEISFSKAFERYGISALESARDCKTKLGKTKEAEEITTKIKELTQKLIEKESGDQSFSVFS